MSQQPDSNLWPFQLLIDLVTEANDVLPIFLPICRISGFIQPGLQRLPVRLRHVARDIPCTLR